MKKLNKLFLAAGSVAAVAAPIAAVVSCGTEANKSANGGSFSSELPSYVTSTFTDTNIKNVFGTTDGGDRNDGSFNEQAKNAIKTLTGTENNFLDARSSSTSDILAAYNQAISKNATTIVATGFMHGGALNEISSKPGNEDKAFIYVDGEIEAQAAASDVVVTAPATDSKLATVAIAATDVVLKIEVVTPANGATAESTKVLENSKWIADSTKLYLDVEAGTKVRIYKQKLQGNVANLLFKSEQGGFLAGYAAATYATANKGADGKAKVATFGGINIPSVTSYMDGFKAGVDFFNNGKAEDAKVELVETQNAFVGNFEADKDNGVTTRANSLIKTGVDVIFPVAGPQEFTVARSILAMDKHVRVIGVDTDMTKARDITDAIKGVTLGSATKQVEQAIVDAAGSIYGVAGHNILPGAAADQKGSQILGKTYVGDLTNKWIDFVTEDTAATAATADATVRAAAEKTTVSFPTANFK